MNNELTVSQQGTGGGLMSLAEVTNQINLIQSLLKKHMKKDEHYGAIPGCGDKPTLLKPGAEKINLMFRMSPNPEIEVVEIGSEGHREYRAKVDMTHIPTGDRLGSGVGACSTMENKYRFRWTNTGNPVPPEYWQSRDKDLLGGDQFDTRKIGGKGWMIFEKIEHDNPADYWNTCLKMAKKRAMVDAVLTVTAASDIFTQDVEDDPETYKNVEGGEKAKEKEPVEQPKRKSEKKKESKSEKKPKEKPKPVPEGVLPGQKGFPDTGIVTIRLKEQKPLVTGKFSNGQVWTLLICLDSNGVEFGSFSERVANKMLDALEKDEDITVVYEPSKKGAGYKVTDFVGEGGISEPEY